MHTRIFNLRHLRAFVAVAEYKTVRLGSEHVHLSQPAVTQGIAGLEADIGVPLFNRAHGRLGLSETGAVYAGRVKRALDLLESGLAATLRAAAQRRPHQVKTLLALLTSTQIRDFVAVGALNNLTLAARAIGSSQPAVHRSIRGLEAVLKIALLERTTQGMALTKAGQMLWRHAKLFEAELAQGLADVRARQGMQGGTIVIGCMPLSRNFVLPQTLNAFTRHYPSVNVHVIEAPYLDLLHGLRHGEIDFLLGALRESLTETDVVQEALFPASLCIAARKGHPLSRKRRVTVHDLARYPWIIPPSGTPTRQRFDGFFSRHGIAISDGLIETSSQVLIRGVLMGSDRLTLISTHQVQLETRMGLLQTLNFDVEESLRDIGITRRQAWIPTQVQQAFLQQLRHIATSSIPDVADIQSDHN